MSLLIPALPVFSSETEETEPVTADLFCVPYPITTTSLSDFSSGLRAKILFFSERFNIPQEVSATKSTINVSLKPDNRALDEVVVIGYGVQRKSAITGSVSEHKEANKNYSFAPTYSYDSENNEEYSSFAENRFKDAKSDPLSTFSLDVDVASYSNVRRMINSFQNFFSIIVYYIQKMS